MFIRNNKLIGDLYEHFVLNNIKNNYDFIWLWNDFPHKKNIFGKNLICDIGADIVAIHNNHYYFIQCKNFKGSIQIKNLSGFYFLIHEYNLNGIVYYNGKLSRKILMLQTNKVKYINLIM